MNTPTSRSAKRAEATRAKLVAAARSLLREPDYATASVARITELADVGLGSFYNHFDTKDALFEAAVHDVLEEQAERTTSLLDPADTAATAAAVSLHVVLQLTEDDPEVAEVIARNGLRLLDADTALAPQGREIIERGIRDGSFSDLDPELLLAVVAGILIGGLHTWSVEPDRVTPMWRSELVARALVALGIDESSARTGSAQARNRLPS